MSAESETTIVHCPNSKCDKAIWSADHADPWCHNCGERFPEDFAEKLPRLMAGRALRQQPVVVYDPPAESGMKQASIAAAITGGLMFLFGLVRFNSVESQLIRGFGGTDSLGVFLLLVGGLLAVGGPILASALAPSSPSNMKSEVFNEPGITTNRIDELERLAELKDRGFLSDEEFQQQKTKILG